MNHTAKLFRQLSSLWHFDATHEHIDLLAQELKSQLETSTGSTCLGLIKREAVPKLFGLTYLLDSYGLILHQRYREKGDGVFVFLESKPYMTNAEHNILHDLPQKQAETDYALAQAA